MNKREIFSGWLWMTLIFVSSVFAQWNPGVNLGSTINTSTTEKASDISSDGLTLYFHHDVAGNMDIYYCTWNGNVWSSPINIGSAINSPYNDYGPSISDDGQRLYFSSNRPGGYGSFDIWVSQRINGVWQQPVNPDLGVNTAYHDANPSISSDGNILHFTSDRPGGYGGFDLYYSTRQTTSIENQQSGVVPVKFELYQNYPNPFNPSTTIRLSLLQREYVTLKVFDVLGREVAILVDKFLQAGIHNSTFNIQNWPLPSGVYFYTLKAGEFIETRKMLLIK